MLALFGTILEVEGQAPLHVPGHRAAAASKSPLRQ